MAYSKTGIKRPRRLRTLDEPVVVSNFHKNRKGDVVRVSLRTYEGVNILDVRQFYTDKAGCAQPTKKGISLSVLRIGDLLDALNKAQRQAADLGLCEPEAAR